MFAALPGGTRHAQAQGIARSIPVVDSLAVQVVIDDYQFAVAPGRNLDGVEVQHFGWGIRDDAPPGRTLVSEFGLAMYVESRRGPDVRRLLMDFGFTPAALINNIQLLGIDPSALDALVLSHGHYDHFGGLAGFLHENKSRLKPKLPLYLGGEESFCSRQWTAPPARGNFGALDRRALRDAGLSVIYAERPTLVAGHGFITGKIALQSFERLLSPTTMKIGLEGDAGCRAEAFPENERALGTVPDQFGHEIATAFVLRDKGLVLLTSCSHRGVVNAVKQAREICGVEKIHALIGGFHLAPYPEAYVRDTVDALREMDIDYIIPLHCSGEPFCAMASAAMPGKVLRSYTGTRFVFS
jgi:7,8-dihydropterin-6-yl-methyl-4-(beta-D-ribofuranosyl)aminobenzene 5'-phosphate synthase